jgi:hypothetical protein
MDKRGGGKKLCDGLENNYEGSCGRTCGSVGELVGYVKVWRKVVERWEKKGPD